MLTLRRSSSAGSSDDQRVASITVDLDELDHYFAIHALRPPWARGGGPGVYRTAVPRLGAWADGERVPITWFAVGRDLDAPDAASILRQRLALGDEVGSHSLDHFYDLVRRGRAELEHQVTAAQEAIHRATGAYPVGFRAPGYTVSDDLFEVLGRAGLRYDSSVFPCPAYYAAKAAVLTMQRVVGRRSAARLDSPMVLAAPRRPYRIGQPYWRTGSGLIEMPIQVSGPLRLPFIGTSLTMAGKTLSRWLTRGVLGERFINLELHGIDALDVHDGLEALASVQPDLRRVVADKLQIYSDVILLLRSAGYSFVTLREAADLAARGCLEAPQHQT